MKKLICLFISAIICFSSLSAKQFFDERYFEMQYTMPVSISNNAFSLRDVLQDELVINLREIAEELPKKGFNQSLDMAPTVGFNFNLPKTKIGFKAGVDISSNLNVSRGLFDFLGYGNQIGEEMNFNTDISADAFAFSSLTIGLKKKQFYLELEPAVFMPLFSVSGNLGNARVLNDSDGKLSVGLSSSVDIFSCLATENFYFTDIFKNIVNSFGFDLSGVFRRPLDEFLNMEIAFSIPIFPGRIRNKAHFDFEYTYDAEVMNFADGVSLNNSEITYEDDFCIYVTRPLNLMGYIDFVPSYLVDLKAGLGFGVRHPFVQNSVPYFQYYIGGSINVGNLLKFTLSTEYTKQIFINQFAFNLNLRILEIDTGISLQSASFAKSFSAAGLGAYLCVSVGY